MEEIHRLVMQYLEKRPLGQTAGEIKANDNAGHKGGF
jgi:hypothetical protein